MIYFLIITLIVHVYSTYIILRENKEDGFYAFIPFYGTYKLYKINKIPGIFIIFNIASIIPLFFNKDAIDFIYIATYLINFKIAKDINASMQIALPATILGPYGRLALAIGMNSGKEITKCPICGKIECNCKICKTCNKKVPDDSDFCPMCGNKII